HVGDTLGIELRPIVEYVDHVRAGARLNARGDPRLHIVPVDGLEVDLQAESLLGLRQQLLAREGVRSRDKIVDAQPMKRRGCCESRLPRCSEDTGQPPNLTARALPPAPASNLRRWMPMLETSLARGSCAPHWGALGFQPKTAPKCGNPRGDFVLRVLKLRDSSHI